MDTKELISKWEDDRREMSLWFVLRSLDNRLTALEAKASAPAPAPLNTELIDRIIAEAEDREWNHAETDVATMNRMSLTLKSIAATARELKASAPAPAPEADTVTISKADWETTQERVKNAVYALYAVQLEFCAEIDAICDAALNSDNDLVGTGPAPAPEADTVTISKAAFDEALGKLTDIIERGQWWPAQKAAHAYKLMTGTYSAPAPAPEADTVTISKAALREYMEAAHDVSMLANNLWEYGYSDRREITHKQERFNNAADNIPLF